MAKKTQKGIFDAANYRELSKPFETTDQANDATEGFWEELYELRNKYRIPDVHVILRYSVTDGDVVTSMHAGSSLYAESMCAWAFGFQQSQRDEMVRRILRDAAKPAR